MIRVPVGKSQTLALLQRVNDMKKAGEDVISFSAGESDFETPKCVVDGMNEAIAAGETRYTDTQGVLLLREEIAKDYRDRLGVSWVQAKHVQISFGAKEGIFLALYGLLFPQGGEVLIPKPYWVSYPSLVKACGGKPVFVETQESNGFFPSIAELNALVTKDTKALLFASPGNPTGTMISEKTLQEIVKWCEDKKITLLFDEIYERIVFKGREHISALKYVSEAQSEFVVSINATSKSMAMTGWRLGYVVTHAESIQSLNALQSQVVTCVPPFIQLGAVKGFQNAHQFLPEVVNTFQRRYELMSEEIKKIPNVHYLEPQGAFYFCVNVEKVMQHYGLKSDGDCAEKLLLEKGLATVPGSGFGMSGWLRISFACSDDEIREGMKRLKSFTAFG